MEKQIVKKVIKSVIIFTFAIFFVSAVFPLQASATIKLDWENPNKTGKTNPYKIKTSDVLNSEMIMQVVGCTGITDKVSNAIVNFAKDLLTEAGRKKVKSKVCSIGVKLGVISGVTSNATIPGGGAQDIAKEIKCNETQQTEDPTGNAFTQETADDVAATKKREECLNGIAITLARNQLTAMTRNTMNWVNTGFEGDPLYIRNITSFTNSLEKNVIETGVNILTDGARPFPYGADFSRTAIKGYNSGSSLRSGAGNFLQSLTSDLSNFITDPNSYYTENQLEKANNANNAFSNDFSSGGWDGWLALTQKDQNNPLGFTMKASEFLQDQQMEQTENAKEELLTNDGFLSQKRCVKWIVIGEDGKPEMKETPLGSPKEKTTTRPDDNDICAPDGVENITPGSLIKDKVSTYLTSPERQLELTDTINESLNSLFTALISKFVTEGLSSLSSASTDANFTSTDSFGGYGNNDLSGNDSISFADLGLDENTTDTSGGYTNGSFDLTRDLGNTYIHNYTEQSRLGNWNAGTNVTAIPASSLADSKIESNLKLAQGIAPIGKDGIPLVNVYYDITTPGFTMIIENGLNDWKRGDRAFWDGEKWQNWKCGMQRVGGKRVCTNQMNPIKKKGILQIQKDYVTAGKEFLSVLPTIMPKLGELDYCIPGPNPNWQTNSGEAEGAFTELASTMKGKTQTRWRCPSGFHPNSLFSSYWSCGACCVKGLRYSRNTSYVSNYVFTTAEAGVPEYDNYYEIFKNTATSWWSKIREGSYWTSFNSRYSTLQNDTRTRLTDQQIIDNAVKQVTADIAVFYKEYGDYINRTYGARSLMQREFLENENTTTLVANPAWLPMSTGGLDVTKDIVAYSEDISATTNTYKDGVIKANENINKLELIKTQVSAIIQAAQKRRDDKLMAEQGLTYDQYIDKYAQCLNEEDIIYYDDFDTTNPANEAERCTDEMDNDLDGLADRKDPDCRIPMDSTAGTCVNGDTIHTSLPITNITCAERRTYGECIIFPYYHSRSKTYCEWVER